MSASVKDNSILARQRYLERVVGSALNEGASSDAIDALLLAEGAATKPDAIRALACRRKQLPTLGAGELMAYGGRDGFRAKLGLPPAEGPSSDFRLTDRGAPDSQDQANVRLALTKLGYHFGYDAFACVEYVSQGSFSAPVDDAILTRAWLHIDTAFELRPKFDFFLKVVSDFARQNSHHPVLDYLRQLPPWDGTRRLDTWLTDYAGAADTPFVRAAGALPLIAAVRRVRQPGTKFDELPVLLGPQGQGKSKLLAALCPRREWFTDCLALGDDPKRTIENTRGIWIAEIGELQGTQREVERIKVFLSRSVDGPARMAYARLPVRAPRQFVNFGTTNDEFFLKDVTGNRRFWPIRVGQTNVELLVADRDQLWAEAVIREAKGESIHLPESLWTVAAHVQAAHRERHPWEDLLESALSLQKPAVAVEATWRAVGLALDASSKRDNRGARLITSVMRRHGYVEKKRIRVRTAGGSTPTLCWVRDPNQSGLDEADVEGFRPF